MSLQSTISVSIKALETAALDLSSPQNAIDFSVVTSLGNGSGSGQAAKVFSDKRTLAASANEDLDLAGSLMSAFGAAITFASIKAILVRAKATNNNNVVIGPAASNGFLGPFADASDRISVRPGGVAIITAPATGWPVTPGTGDLLNIANSAAGSAIDYDIILIGT
jgi:hypothetical protein